jgi:hypothetical protein
MSHDIWPRLLLWAQQTKPEMAAAAIQAFLDSQLLLPERFSFSPKNGDVYE